MTTPAYMETNDASLVRLIKTGAIFIRDVGSPAPTGTAWTPDLGDVDHHIGYYSEDGFTLSPQPGDESEFTAHNGDIVITEQAPGYWTVSFQGLQSNAPTAEAYFDTEVAEDGSITVTSAATAKEYDLVVAGMDQRDRPIVAHFPRAKINSREDMVFNRQTLLTYGMTFRTFKGGSAAPYHFKAWGFVPEDSESSSSSSSSSGA